MSEILIVEGLKIWYGEKKVVSDINFTVKSGEIVIIAGESGSGKSTILKSIGGLLGKGGKTEGRIFFDGKELNKLSEGEMRKILGDLIGYIFQNAGLSFCPIRKIGDQIYESVKFHREWTKNEFMTRAEGIIEKIGLKPEILGEYPFKLSGGMAQRAGILAATILEPKLLLADEPTSALDIVTQAGVIKELLKLRERLKISIIMVTHDLKVAKKLADKVLIMKKGELVEMGTRDEIFDSPREIYTQKLIRAANL